ncbi:DUF3995 domain-containing protein [Paenibacillus sp. SI8]|uniref:DUF3995 domain-containing protein n=1 Tax=unclassified Paenibacillus TaxID=185978 RepID=UPI003467C23D
MNEQLVEAAGILVAAVLAVDGLLHAYWATGAIWPASNKLSLAQAVLNSNKTQLFKPRGLILLTTLLCLGALIVLARIHHLGVLGDLISDSVLQLGILVVTAGLLLRGLAGIVWALGLVAAKSKLFFKLNLMVYTPACLILFAAAVVVACS